MPLEDSHQTFSRRRERAHTQTNTHPHIIRHTIFHIRTVQTHISSGVLSLCEAEAGGSWRARLQRAQYSWIWELENSLNSLQQEPHKDTTSAYKPLFALKILTVWGKNTHTVLQSCWPKRFIVTGWSWNSNCGYFTSGTLYSGFRMTTQNYRKLKWTIMLKKKKGAQ